MQIQVAAKVILSHPSKEELLLVKRSVDGQLGYEPAGGRLDIDFLTSSSESFETAAVREAKEELNLDVELLGYLGSYHFFWGENNQRCTHCNVYAADILSDLSNLSSEGDPGKYPIYPEWVSIEKLKNGAAPIRDAHVGLRQVYNQALKFFYQIQLV